MLLKFQGVDFDGGWLYRADVLAVTTADTQVLSTPDKEIPLNYDF